jgi:hypothetical protein
MLYKLSLIAALVAVLAHPSAALAKHVRGHATSLKVEKQWSFGREIIIVSPPGTQCHMVDYCILTCTVAPGKISTIGVCI